MHAERAVLIWKKNSGRICLDERCWMQRYQVHRGYLFRRTLFVWGKSSLSIFAKGLQNCRIFRKTRICDWMLQQFWDSWHISTNFSVSYVSASIVIFISPKCSQVPMQYACVLVNSVTPTLEPKRASQSRKTMADVTQYSYMLGIATIYAFERMRFRSSMM